MHWVGRCPFLPHHMLVSTVLAIICHQPAVGHTISPTATEMEQEVPTGTILQQQLAAAVTWVRLVGATAAPSSHRVTIKYPVPVLLLYRNQSKSGQLKRITVECVIRYAKYIYILYKTVFNIELKELWSSNFYLSNMFSIS